MSETAKQDTWAVVDLFGHTRIAGRVSEHVMGGCSFVRVDVPAICDAAEFTELYGPSAIYAIRFVSEEIARGVAESLKRRPISVYDLPTEMRERLKSLPAPVTADDYDDYSPIGDDD